MHLRLHEHLQSRCWYRISDPSGAPCPQFSLCSGMRVYPLVFQYFVELKQIVCLSPGSHTEIPLASSAGILAKRGSVSGPESIQSSWKEHQNSHFCTRSSWELDLFLFLYSVLCSIQKLCSIFQCWYSWKRLPSIISYLMHLAPLNRFGNPLFNLQLQSILFTKKMQITWQRIFLSKPI